MGGVVDRRVKVNFKTLNEEQENKIISSLMDFLIWYKDNEKIINKDIEQKRKKVNDISIVDFWIENIGKSEEIEEYLKDINVVADCYEYVKKYKDIILTLKTNLKNGYVLKRIIVLKNRQKKLKGYLRNYKTILRL